MGEIWKKYNKEWETETTINDHKWFNHKFEMFKGNMEPSSLDLSEIRMPLILDKNKI